jgi:hypothetical protein
MCKKLGFTRKMLLALKNTLIQRTKTSDSDPRWRIVSFINGSNPIFLAYFARDRLNGDPNCGIFGIFDGHGGR